VRSLLNTVYTSYRDQWGLY